MDYIALGKEIRELRRKRNLTQEKLAELADLSVPYISYGGPAAQRKSGKGYGRIFSGGSGTFGRLLRFGASRPYGNCLCGETKHPDPQVEPSAIKR